ncbi:E3 ubiquitin-protein ligase BRE1-like 2 [Juglans microcarpa x Juglans regia]|uniref:E3 ubiquitin-protein ligase BRE1-like 2 n=1 Tax=Juglans microcarpa x Juglans regia TaxID=2249226 RepID=UPI001B7E9F22|nr:E3 ubiquitin-protein ligase BRE1-like 2 [Juglans microcarpa x Juglans regia]
MENEDSDEPERKRHHLNSVSSAMARNSTTSPPNDRSVDATVLQHQNQKLLQQIDVQKHELHELEAKIKELKDNQCSYDDVLIVVNQLWNQLVDDLILLGVRAGAGQIALEFLDHADHCRGSVPSCPAEEIFLCRLLKRDSIDVNGNKEIIKYVEEALALRHSSTSELLKLLEDTINDQRVKTESIARTLHGKLSSEDAIIQLSKIDDMMKEEAIKLREAIGVLHLKHIEYIERIQTYISSHSADETEIKRLAGELDECMTELEESRRKLVNLQMQKDGASWIPTPTRGTVNGNLSPEKPADKTMGLRELKDSIEEAKVLAEDRLSELQDAQEENQVLSKQLQDLQNELKDEKYVRTSRLYSLRNDQLQHWNAEVERYKVLTDSLQADRPLFMRREKEVIAKLESANVVRNAVDNAESRIEELEHQLQKCVIEKNDLEIKMEEALQDAGRKDIKSEFHVMSSALSKEMGMMKAQLKRWRETAHEALSLREEAQSLKAQLNRKNNEKQSLADKCAEQMAGINSLKELIEQLQKEKLELQIFLDMYGQESYENRDLMEIKESERRAHSQAEVLRNALDEHSLELRVKAANEAEAACQQRLSAAEAEIADLRAKLDASERDVLELTEAIRSKDGEAEAYISEIETIGQAYEDMQTQNQHLLQQLTERDDYNIKLVSESVKTKQAQSVLLSEKQALAKQLQQINASVESLKMKISYSEEQMETCLTEAIKSTQEERHFAVNLEMAKWELAEAEKELKWLKSAVASSEKEYEQIQQDGDDLQFELENERSSRKKLEEELRELNIKVADMSSETGEAAIQKLQDEIKSCKSILKCSVCSDRPKEVVIVKCYHLFCNPCIQKNLEIRHRKCPACGNAFGQNDVRFVKI